MDPTLLTEKQIETLLEKALGTMERISSDGKSWSDPEYDPLFKAIEQLESEQTKRGIAVKKY